ncbi:MAG: ABC transporter ATP-binding protein, partial [Clostridiales bacterium]|nr:ABC transporter ATP-binding protein [Clostridiales bacterium]
MNAIRALGRLFGMDGRARRLALAALLAAAGSVALSLYAPVLIGRGVDLVVGPGQVRFSPLAGVLAALALVTAGAAACQWLMSACANGAAYSLARALRARAFESLNRAPVGYIDSHRHGDILSRLISDVDQVTDGLVMGLAQFFASALTILGTIGFMFSLNAVIALIVVLVTPLSLFVARFIATRTHAMFARQTASRGDLTALISEQAANMKLVVAFNAQGRSRTRFDRANEVLREAGEKAVFYSSLVNPSTRFVNSVVYIAVGAFGALAAIRGAISVGGLVSFLSYANQSTKPFNEVSGVIAELQGALASAARAFELIDQPPERPDEIGAIELTDPSGEVAFCDVSFSYDAARPLIRGLNLVACPGQRIAIVGATGSGKT